MADDGAAASAEAEQRLETRSRRAKEQRQTLQSEPVSFCAGAQWLLKCWHSQGILACGVCGDPLPDVAVSLPTCEHKFCLKCLRQNLRASEDGTLVACPVDGCHTLCQVMADDPQQEFVQHTDEPILPRRQLPKCVDCDDKIASWKCEDCRRKPVLCNDCNDEVHSHSRRRDHRRHRLDAGAAPIETANCSTHAAYPLGESVSLLTLAKESMRAVFRLGLHSGGVRS